MVGIYCILNTNTGKRYVGLSRRIEKRRTAHFSALKYNRHNNAHMQRAYQQDAQYFVFQICEECDKDQLNERERFWIAYYQSNNQEFGYNIEDGGESGKHHASATKALISAAHKGKSLSELHRQRISAGGKGRKPSPKSVEHIRNLYLNKTIPDATKQAVARGNKTRIVTQSARQKMTDARLGKPIHDQEFKDRLTEYNKTREITPELLENMARGVKEAYAKKREEQLKDVPFLFDELKKKDA